MTTRRVTKIVRAVTVAIGVLTVTELITVTAPAAVDESPYNPPEFYDRIRAKRAAIDSAAGNCLCSEVVSRADER